MAEESPPSGEHAERVRRRGGVRKSSLVLSPDSKYDWPANLGELLEWYGHEITDVNRAAQMRIASATKIVDDCVKEKISLEEVVERLREHDDRWRDIFHGGVSHVGGMTDEEIYKAIDEAHKRRAKEYRERS
jgi:hypothetical protein